MNVHLTPDLEQLVESKVKSGRYNSPSDVVRDALRLLEHRDNVFTRHDRINAELKAALPHPHVRCRIECAMSRRSLEVPRHHSEQLIV